MSGLVRSLETKLSGWSDFEMLVFRVGDIRRLIEAYRKDALTRWGIEVTGFPAANVEPSEAWRAPWRAAIDEPDAPARRFASDC